jgi:hypothetical protein
LLTACSHDRASLHSLLRGEAIYTIAGASAGVTASIQPRRFGRVARAALLLLATQLLLSACSGGSVQRALGLSKRSPDEFAVVSRAPLIVPPDFELRPPRPGEARPQIGTTADQARARLLGQSAAEPDGASLLASGAPATASLPTTSSGQQALLQQAGGGSIDPDVRQRLAVENQSLAAVEGDLFTRLLQWRQPVTLGATVDAPAEAERLLANRAGGQPATTGDTPSVVERRQSPLGALVDKVF